MKCPICGADGAYVGLRDVKCLSASCRSYDSDYANEESMLTVQPMLPVHPIEPSDFAIHQGLRTRYAKLKINPDFYTTGRITTLEKWKPLIPEYDSLELREMTALLLENMTKWFSKLSDDIVKNTVRGDPRERPE